MKKLHLACGSVYLQDYINIDLKLPNSYLAKEHPRLMKRNLTTVDNYYKTNVTKLDFLKGKFQQRKIVCDRFADIRKLPYKESTIDKILGVQVFEHFTFKEGRELLKYWYKLLKVNGSIALYVPDIEGIIKQYNKDNDIEWAIRQLYGSQKNEFGLHKAGYTQETLAQLFIDLDFRDVSVLDNINNYPAFGMIGYK